MSSCSREGTPFCGVGPEKFVKLASGETHRTLSSATKTDRNRENYRMKSLVSSPLFSRRRFLLQSFGFSALATLGRLPMMAATVTSDSAAAELLMIGDWGYDDNHTAQSKVAAVMGHYAQEHELRVQALLLLGDNWYGALDGGVHSPRWQAQFESMYPADAFDNSAYAILGNHDYQRWPDSKVDAELEYARSGKTRWSSTLAWPRS